MASNSYRAAEYFAPIEDPRHTELGLRSRDAFRAAMQSSDWLFEPLEIVVEISGCLVTAWRRKPRDSRVLLAVSGFDGTLEETYLQVGVAGLQRGLVVGRPAAVVRSFRDHHSGDARGRGLPARFPRGRTGRPVRARPACARAVLSR